jgi:3',5'-cyclic AMP phosphodiesterase CpdA
MSSTAAVQLAHISDIHLTTVPLGWRFADWFTKRGPGWLNLEWFGRQHGFRAAERVLTALAEELRQRRPDRVIFSGDATALGFEAELARAAALLGVSGPDALPGLAVPGNHDYYTRGAATSGLFEHYFAPWQKGERINGSVYPFAQRAGHVWLVAVNSSTGNRWFWDAAGSVGPEQLARLAKLLERLSPGPRILVTHYPVCRANAAPEARHRRLRDLPELLAVAERGGICLWLHGHRHAAYHQDNAALAPFPIVCAGSATQSGRWSYGSYTITGQSFHAVRRIFSPTKGSFRDGEAFDLELRCRAEFTQPRR